MALAAGHHSSTALSSKREQYRVDSRVTRLKTDLFYMKLNKTKLRNIQMTHFTQM